jgi:protein TonB
MFNTLLESRARVTRRTGGTVVSVAGHASLVAALVFVTARQSIPTGPEPVDVPLRFTNVVTPPPSVSRPTPAGAPQVYSATAPAPLARTLSAVVDIPLELPPVDLSRAPTNADDFATGRRGGALGGVPGGTGVEPSDGVYFEGQVEKPVILLPGTNGPAYPELLRTAGIEGMVLAQFVVDSTGRAIMASFAVLRSDHPQFSASVRASLMRLRFVPAEVGGRKVAQLVQLPFQFAVTRHE